MHTVGRKKVSGVFMLLFTIFLMKGMLAPQFIGHAEMDWKAFPNETNVPLNKEWTITFMEVIQF